MSRFQKWQQILSYWGEIKKKKKKERKKKKKKKKKKKVVFTLTRPTLSKPRPPTVNFFATYIF